LVEDVITDPEVVFMFPDPEKLSPPLMKLDEAWLGYTEGTTILKKVNFYVDLESVLLWSAPMVLVNPL